MSDELKELGYVVDEDCGTIDFFYGEDFITTWVYENEPEDIFKEFKLIYNLGFKHGAKHL